MTPEQPALAPHDVRRIVAGILLAMLLGALDQTIVATALPTIGADLGDLTNLSWVVTAYLIAATAVTPLYGKFADIHGRRIVMLVAVSIFSAASIACALAPNMLVLCLARAVQGLGGGGLLSVAQTIIGDVVPPRERGRYQGLIVSVFGGASIGGPVLGGFFAEHLHWSMIFWINLPLGLAAFLMTDRTLRRLPRYERRHQVDVLGAVLMLVAAVSVLLALSWGGVRYPWISIEVLGLAALSAATAATFVWRVNTAPEPFLPLHLVTNPVVSRAIPVGFVTMGCVIAVSVTVPLYFETVRGFTAGQSGLGLIPFMGGVVAGSVVSGQSMSRLAHYKRPAVMGLAFSALSFAGLGLWNETLGLASMLALLTVAGAGMGTVLPVITVSSQNAVSSHQLGTVTGIMNFFRSLGSSFLVAAFGAILLGALGPGMVGDIGALAHGAGKTHLAHGFTLVFYAAALCMLVGVACLMAMEERPLRATAYATDESLAG